MSRPAVPSQVQEALPRTTHGLQSFKDIAHGLRFAKWLPFDPRRGTLLDKARGECFVGVDSSTECPVSGIHGRRALVGRLSFLAPGAERVVQDRLSLRVTPWRDTGWALVTLADSTYVGAEWVAFVPTAEVVAAVQEAQQ